MSREWNETHEGVVVDSITGRVIEGALVAVKHKYYGGMRMYSYGVETTSNAEGIFHLQGLRPTQHGFPSSCDEYTVVCHAKGFQRWAFYGGSLPSTLTLLPNDGTNCGEIVATSEVKLVSEEFRRFYDFGWSLGTPTEGFWNVVSPTGTKFSDLLPGYYHVYDPGTYHEDGGTDDRLGRKVAVEPGKTTRVTHVGGAHSARRDLSIAVTKSDGGNWQELVSNCTVYVNQSWSVKLDQDGSGSTVFGEPSNTVFALKMEIGSNPRPSSRLGDDATHWAGPIHVCTATSLTNVHVDFYAASNAPPVFTENSRVREPAGKKTSKERRPACEISVVRAQTRSPVANVRWKELFNCPDNHIYGGLMKMATFEGKVKLRERTTRNTSMDPARLVVWDPPFGGAAVVTHPYPPTISLASCSVRGRVRDYKKNSYVSVHVSYDNEVVDGDVAKQLHSTVGVVDVDFTDPAPDGAFRVGCILPGKPFIVLAVRDRVFSGRPIRCKGLEPGEELTLRDLEAPSVGIATFYQTEPFAKARIFPYALAEEESLTVMATRQALLNGDIPPEGWEDDLLPHGVGSAIPHVLEERHADCRGVMRVDGFPSGMALLVDSSSGAAHKLSIPGQLE